MRVIQLHRTEQKLIEKAQKNSRRAQKELFDKYAPKMLSVARYYIKDLHTAEDIMISSFYKALTKLDSFKNEGNFEGWIRRIVVNDCISHTRKRKDLCVEDEVLEAELNEKVTSAEQKYDIEEIQRHIDKLPSGYKMVFNLFVIEGYKHKEIAEMLSISESTSKSQFFKARKLLQNNLRKNLSRPQSRDIS